MDSPIRNSDLNKFRLQYLNEEVELRFLQQYFNFGSLVDALITEPEMVDINRGILKSRTRYDHMCYYFDRLDIRLALDMKAAFEDHPLCRRVQRQGKKTVFSNKTFLYKDKILWTEGEADLLYKGADVNLDIKVTVSETEKEFYRSVKKLFYDQQGAWYMDNFNVSNHIVVGISRKKRDENNKPLLFFYPITRGHRSYRDGKERYEYWLDLLLKSKVTEEVYADT